MSRPRPLPALVLPLLLAGALAGCGDGGTSSAASAVTSAEAGATGSAADESEAEAQAEADTGVPLQAGAPAPVDCPTQATAVALPATFPAPLPDGTVVAHVEEGPAGRTVLAAVVPADRSEVLAELRRVYPAAGLSLSSEVTGEHEAGANFTGNGMIGRWGIRELDDCGSPATRIDVVVRRL